MRRQLITLLWAGGLLAAAAACSGDADSAEEPASAEAAPSTSTSTSAPASSDGPTDVAEVGEDLEPGTYFVDPDQDPDTPLRVVFDVADEGWSGWIGAVKITSTDLLGLSISTVSNVVRDGCTDHSPASPAVGPTVEDLATALGGLAPFETTEPRSVTVDGYDGLQLTLTAPEIEVDRSRGTREFACSEGNLGSWMSPTIDGYFNGYNGEPGTSEEISILDVDGTRLLISSAVSPQSTEQDVAELDALVDSIQIEP